ncbi:hypothetical protein KEM52_006163 [Ascosphaera acerosa]|nr:hypothetical protein KEM52_006163 [Ascosphaera acerosa]
MEYCARGRRGMLIQVMDKYSAPPPDEAAAPRNVGDSDVAPDGIPSQFLLFRGLDSGLTEDHFAKGVAKLYKPANSAVSQSGGKAGAKVSSTTGNSNLGAREGSVRRVLLVRDKRSDESWGYGFAEFATVNDAQAALARYNSFSVFTIASKPVLASYIHAGVFVPVLDATVDGSEQHTFSPLGNPSMKLAYWDHDAYVAELAVSEGEPDTRPAAAGANSDKAKSKSAADKPRKRKTADAVPTLAPKKIALSSHLQFWSDRHAELHGIPKHAASTQTAGGATTGPATGDGAAASSQSQDSSGTPAKSYANFVRLCCYLCMRQFKSAADVNRHERLSELHRKHLQDPAMIARAEHKLTKQRDAITVQQQQEQQQASAAAYRDRAKERRQVFGSTGPTKAGKHAARGRGTPRGRSPEPAPQPTMSKGAALLGKMGWSAGTGLGAQGTGVTAPVAQNLYAQGVGLGAQGGKIGDAVEEAGRRTKGRYDDFLEKTREQAKQRYEQMMKEQP